MVTVLREADLRWVWNNEYGSFPDGQVGGERSLCKGNNVVPMDLNVQWLLSCGMDRYWESSEEFLSRGQSQNPCRPLVSGPRVPSLPEI